LIGETVTVRIPGTGEADPFGGTTTTWTEATVSDVLVQPGTSADLSDSNRPDGMTVDMTLHFPKTFAQEMRGAEVVARGHVYTVVGDPQPYTVADCPTRWNYPVGVTRSDG